MAKLDAKERNALPKRDFAVPSKGKGSGSYPIPDKAHARAALSRGAANASPKEDAEIKRKVAAKFPSMKVKGKEKR